MSKINDLRTNPKYQFAFIDILSDIVPERKVKYVETFLRILFNKDENIMDIGHFKKYLKNNFSIPNEVLDKYDDFTIFMFYSFVENIYGLDNMKEFSAFCEFSEKNLIKNTDLSQYKSIIQVIGENNYVLEKLEEKELERQIYKIFENDDWLVLRPLSFEASKKYGAHTTWCTTSDQYQSEFNKYTKNGMLIYCIGKKKDYKVAVSYWNNETIFWGSDDKKINPLDTNIPPEIIYNYIHPEIKSGITNIQIYDRLQQQKTQDDVDKVIDKLSKERPSAQQDYKKILKGVFEGSKFQYTDLNDDTINPDDFIAILKETFRV